MSYLVFCTFDLKGANSADYQNAYSDLAKIGLTRVHKQDAGGDVVIPTTSAMGLFNGKSASDVVVYARNAVQAAFRARRFKSELFLTAGDNWSWVAGTT